VVPDKKKHERYNLDPNRAHDEIQEHVAYEHDKVLDYADMLQGYKPFLAMIRSCVAAM